MATARQRPDGPPVGGTALHSDRVANAGRPLGNPARLLLCPLLAALLFVPAGCGQRAAADSPYDLTITVEKGFVKRQSSYVWFPSRDDSLFNGILGDGDLGSGTHDSSGSHGGRGLHLDLGGNDAGALVVALAVIVAVVVLAETVDVTYHHVHGLRLALKVEGDDLYESFPLHWGENRVRFPHAVRARLGDGTAALFLGSSGTRQSHLLLPLTGVDWERARHVVTLAASGDCILDERTVGMPGSPLPR